MKKIIISISILIFLIYVPNLLWLTNSTAIISNNSSKSLNLVNLYIDKNIIHIGTLKPGESRFMFLPKSGDASYEIIYLKGGKIVSNCKDYIESEMYHAETKFFDSEEPECSISLPLFSELFITKILNKNL